MIGQGCIVETVGVGGRFVSVGPEVAEAAGTAVVAVQRQGQERQRQVLAWAVPGFEVVLEL